MARQEKGFQVPPEVPRYFADKGLKPRFSWLDVWAEEHAHSFTVAKAVEVELLTAFRDSIRRAIAEGKGFDTWRDGLRPELERLGWWGKRLVKDPTGQDPDRMVDFSSPRRLQTIFWSNMRAARAAGQWERIQRTKGALPYLLYVRTTAAEPRPEHLSWTGTILPADDPFWRTHFPPNGWGCKCAVRQISRFEADRLGKTKGYSREAHQVEERRFVNRRTGEVTSVPVGIDPGWHTNPGLARAQTLVSRMQERLEEAGPAIAKSAIADLLATPAPKILMGLPERVRLPVAVAGHLEGELRARSPLVAASNETMRTKVRKHAPVTPESFAFVQQIIDEGEVLDENRGENQRTVIGTVAGKLWKLVLVRSAVGFLRVQTLHRIDERRLAKLKRKAEG